jgi:MinD-like ATPase involved in chromosome partitioning or flagellar assembly
VVTTVAAVMERRFTPRPLRRKDVYPQAVLDGHAARSGPVSAASLRMSRVLTSKGERDEAELEAKLHEAGGNLSRPNTVAVISPKGGVGKTSCTYLIGTLLASRKRLRVLAVDVNPDFGTLASLAPEATRSPHNAADLYQQLESVPTSAAVRSYVTVLSSGLHILAGPERPEVMAAMTPQRYGILLVFLAQFYDVILLDMGTGIVDPLAQLGVSRADHVLVVTDQEYATANRVLSALRHLDAPEDDEPTAPLERLTVVLNKMSSSGDRVSVREAFRKAGVRRQVVVPHDAQLATMLDSSSYTLEGLRRATRMAIREMGLVVAQRLV